MSPSLKENVWKFPKGPKENVWKFPKGPKENVWKFPERWKWNNAVITRDASEG